MDRLKRNKLFFGRIKRKPMRTLAIKNINSDQLKSICDLCSNVVHKRLQVTPTQFKKLRKQRNIIRELSSRRISLKRKKALLQKGGFLNILAPILGSLATTLLGGLL